MYVINDIANTTMTTRAHALSNYRTLMNYWPMHWEQIYNVQTDEVDWYKVFSRIDLVNTGSAPESNNYVVDYDKRNDTGYWRTRIYGLLSGVNTSIYDELYEGTYKKKELKKIFYEFKAPLASLDITTSIDCNMDTSVLKSITDSMESSTFTLHVDTMPTDLSEDITSSSDLFKDISVYDVTNYAVHIRSADTTDVGRLPALWILDLLASKNVPGYVRIFKETSKNVLSSSPLLLGTTQDNNPINSTIYNTNITIKKVSDNEDSYDALTSLIDSVLMFDGFVYAKSILTKTFAIIGAKAFDPELNVGALQEYISKQGIFGYPKITGSDSVIYAESSEDYDPKDDGFGDYKSGTTDYGIIAYKYVGEGTPDGDNVAEEDLVSLFGALDPEFAMKLFYDMLDQDMRVKEADMWAKVVAVILIIAAIVVTILSLGADAPISAAMAGWILTGIGLSLGALSAIMAADGQSANSSVFGKAAVIVGYVSLVNIGINQLNRMVLEEVFKDGVWEGIKSELTSMSTKEILMAMISLANTGTKLYGEYEIKELTDKTGKVNEETNKLEREMNFMPTPKTIVETQWYNDTYQYMEHTENIDSYLKASTDMSKYTNKYF